MERELAVLVLVTMWAGANSQAIYCESQPLIKEGVLEIPLGNYATLICEHQTRDNAGNEGWYLDGNFRNPMEQGGHEDLLNKHWETVSCLFLKNISRNTTCSRFFVIIAATSNEFNNSETKACTHLLTQSNGRPRVCDQRTFIVRIIEKERILATPSPTISLYWMSTSSLLSSTVQTSPSYTSLKDPPSTTVTPRFLQSTTPRISPSSTIGPLPTMTIPLSDLPTDPPGVTGSSIGWVNLSQWENIFSLASILNNVLQTILLIIVIILIVKTLPRNRKQEEHEEESKPQQQATISQFEINGRGDETDSALSAIYQNDSAIDMTGQPQPIIKTNRPTRKLKEQQSRAFKRQNSKRPEETWQ